MIAGLLDAAHEFGLTPKMRLASYALSGVEPEVMGLGPIPSTEKALPLIEVVHTPDTDARSLETAIQIARALGKTPVRTADAPRFVVNRLLAIILGEAARALDAGTLVADVEQACAPLALPMRPFRLVQLIGRKVSAHILDTMASRFPERFHTSTNLHRLADIPDALSVVQGQVIGRNAAAAAALPVGDTPLTGEQLLRPVPDGPHPRGVRHARRAGRRISAGHRSLPDSRRRMAPPLRRTHTLAGRCRQLNQVARDDVPSSRRRRHPAAGAHYDRKFMTNTLTTTLIDQVTLPDHYAVFADLPQTDRTIWARTRQYVTELRPRMTLAWDRADYPTDVVPALGKLDLLIDGVRHPELPEMSPLAAGLVNMEVSRADGSLGTVIAVQAGLALRTLVQCGSAEQLNRWVRPVARGEVLAAFALTEPDHGSDSVALETAARRTETGWRITGDKRWIGNGASGGITFVWARVDDPGASDHQAVRCFLVPQDTPGYRGTVITGKGSVRAIHQADIQLDVHVPESALLPGARTFKDAAAVLLATRAGVAWSALGHATACYETAASYTAQRHQFGRAIAGFQLVQERLARMLTDLTSMQLHCLRIAALDDAGTLRPAQASMAKFHNTRTARQVAATARDIMGGNGILLEYGVIQHQADIEAIHTYEGTESIQALLLGRDITGISAFTG